MSSLPEKPRRSLWKKVLLRTAVTVGIAFAGFASFALLDGWDDLGKAASGARLARMERSPQYRNGRFENPEPLANDLWGSFAGLLEMSAHVNPDGPIPTAVVDPDLFRTPPPGGVRVTWFGHSSELVELDGHRVLTDPVFSERASPVQWLGPKRWFPAPLTVDELPELDAVVISHDHYDHLDRATVVALLKTKALFVVPLGVGAHLEYWGIPSSRIVELDWWEKTNVGTLEIVCTPARHASGRHLFDKDTKLWAGYALIGPEHRIFFSGDTGLFRAMKEIGERLGPFDLTMIETGQYHRAWPDWHIGPEQAVLAHEWLRGKVMLPIHWGLFGLAFHGWTEPIERVTREAEKKKVSMTTPKPGESTLAASSLSLQKWWPNVPWTSGEMAPIRSTQVD